MEEIISKYQDKLLTFNKVTKICCNHILLTPDEKISKLQWFNFQLEAMCKILKIDSLDMITNTRFNNEILGNLIRKKIGNKQQFKLSTKNYEFFLNFGLIPRKYLSLPEYNLHLSDSKNEVIYDINNLSELLKDVMNYGLPEEEFPGNHKNELSELPDISKSSQNKISLKEKSYSFTEDNDCLRGHLSNLDATRCYMDTILFMVLKLTKENFLSKTINDIIHGLNDYSLIDNIMIELNNSDNQFTLKLFIDSLEDDNIFKPKGQNDVYAFLRWLFTDYLTCIFNYQFNRVNKFYFNYVGNIENEYSHHLLDLGNITEQFSIPNNEIVEKMIETNFKTKVLFDEPSFILTEIINFLPFIDQDNNPVKLENLLKYQIISQEKENLYQVDDKSYNTLIEQIIIDDCDILLINIQRSRGNLEPIEEHQVIPPKYIHLNNQKLIFTSVVCFQGSENNGHYVLYFICNDKWYMYNDIADKKVNYVTDNYDSLIKETQIKTHGVIFLYNI